MSRADVLGGQLAEATERPVKPSARAGFLEETLVATFTFCSSVFFLNQIAACIFYIEAVVPFLSFFS